MRYISLEEFQSSKKYRTIPCHEKSLVGDLQRGKISVIVLECNLQRAYGSPMHKMAIRQWPALASFGPEHPSVPHLGQIENYTCPMSTPNRLKIVSNLYSGQSVIGVPIPGSNRMITKQERFSPDAFKKGMIKLVKGLRAAHPGYDFDRQIAVQRFGGGYAGHDWEEIQAVLDEVCVELELSIFAYLPRKIGNIPTRG